LPEYGRIPRAELGETLCRRLHAFDSRHARQNGDKTIFDWDRLSVIRAQNYVGVVQIPGLTIEILPKVDRSPEEVESFSGTRDERRVLAQHNLIYMLSLTQTIPVQERDLAGLAVHRMPLLEALMSVFIQRLLAELKKGLDRAYVHRTENAHYLKGKLLISQHIRRNAAHKERVYIGYDEFVADTWLNRILKAACRQLLALSRTVRVQQALREALLHFADVSDHPIREHHFAKVHLNRNTERFADLLGFARIVLTRSTPTLSQGESKTFSLLFPMEQLFESFVAEFIRRYRNRLGLEDHSVHAQAVGRRLWLLETPEDRGKFCLKPDIMIDDPAKKPIQIVDTKWKRLKSDQEDTKNGVSQADIYQLYAYAHRYGCPDNVLLFPKVDGVTPKTYRIPDTSPEKQLRIAFVDMNRDLRKNKDRLIDDLRTILQPSSPIPLG